MKKLKAPSDRLKIISSVLCLAALSAVSTTPLHAGPTSVNPDYTVSVFAPAPSDITITNPDSIETHLGFVFVSYGNTAAPDGSSGNSNIIQYTSTGQVVRTWQVVGSNDGLRYNPFDDTLWALRNQDGNPAVTVFNITTGSSRDLVYANAPLHGGGYDDVVFVNDQAFLSASNPKLNAQGQNIYPSIVNATVVGSRIFTAPVLLGNATLTDIATGQPTVSPQSDPDSMTIDPSGDLVLDSQADGDLIFLRGPGFPNQVGFRLHLSNGTANQVTVDDTVFPSATAGTIYVADTKANIVYAVTSNAIPPNSAFSASNSDGTLVRTDLISGQVTPIVTGFMSPHGAHFAPALPQIRLQRASAALTFASKEVSGLFLVSRTGDISQALTVFIRVTDHSKRDPAATSHLVQVVIPATKSLVTASIHLDSIADLNEDAAHQACVVTVDPDPNYDVVPYVNDGGVQVVVIPTQTN